ncbi:hypothetical protein Rhow_000940 [Rhodococcus wratislaviensis]|uniref:Uncharacterized protein n=1 Tax=Rhodococcus wratislaviensis TaxID=44752 RepID=A0A402CMX4_RHOWR|nr:hypothetical protein Rhow_000940 [Rhodococcus wratislaviensis]
MRRRTGIRRICTVHDVLFCRRGRVSAIARSALAPSASWSAASRWRHRFP